ncbi:MAG: hypothetical protein CM15mP129_03810 [Chloroflexota bacterium]|nr:MAG: hypothetical protein CM15mP129_03810 [Chloroflexota bacterium]
MALNQFFKVLAKPPREFQKTWKRWGEGRVCETFAPLNSWPDNGNLEKLEDYYGLLSKNTERKLAGLIY